jgi:hypothetical protein
MWLRLDLGNSSQRIGRICGSIRRAKLSLSMTKAVEEAMENLENLTGSN